MLEACASGQSSMVLTNTWAGLQGEMSWYDATRDFW